MVYSRTVSVKVGLEIDSEGWLRTKLYDTRDDFNFLIVNFPYNIYVYHFESFMVVAMTLLTVLEYLCHKWRRICSICRERFPVLSSFMTYICIIGFVTRLTWWVPLVDQERLALPKYLTSLPEFSGVRVTRSLVLCVCFVDRCLSIVLLLFTDSAYPIGIFKLFLTYSTI